jgi:hypothetical protein
MQQAPSLKKLAMNKVVEYSDPTYYLRNVLDQGFDFFRVKLLRTRDYLFFNCNTVKQLFQKLVSCKKVKDDFRVSGDKYCFPISDNTHRHTIFWCAFCNEITEQICYHSEKELTKDKDKYRRIIKKLYIIPYKRRIGMSERERLCPNAYFEKFLVTRVKGKCDDLEIQKLWEQNEKVIQNETQRKHSEFLNTLVQQTRGGIFVDLENIFFVIIYRNIWIIHHAYNTCYNSDTYYMYGETRKEIIQKISKYEFLRFQLFSDKNLIRKDWTKIEKPKDDHGWFEIVREWSKGEILPKLIIERIQLQ